MIINTAHKTWLTYFLGVIFVMSIVLHIVLGKVYFYRDDHNQPEKFPYSRIGIILSALVASIFGMIMMLTMAE